MTSIVTDFKSIKRICDRMEQKADFEAKNPEPTQSRTLVVAHLPPYTPTQTTTTETLPGIDEIYEQYNGGCRNPS